MHDAKYVHTKKIYGDTITNFAKNVSSDQLLLRSLKVLKPRKDEAVTYIAAIGISVIISWIFSFNIDSVSYFKSASSVLLTVILALFAVVFTGYALFQALLGKKMLSILLRVGENGKIEEKNSHISMLQTLNESFSNNLMLNYLCIILNLLITIIESAVPDDWCISTNIILCNWISFVLITCYLYLNFMAIFDVKSFIGNIVKAFYLFAGTEVEELKESGEIQIVSSSKKDNIGHID